MVFINQVINVLCGMGGGGGGAGWGLQWCTWIKEM